jgi:KRAB domain-containing zinc finger protein
MSSKIIKKEKFADETVKTSYCNGSKIAESDNCIKNNIKKEPEVEFVLILPPRQLKVEKDDEENQNQTQSSEKKFQCQQCPKSFDNQIALIKHKQTHESKVKCKICSKEIKTRYLKEHLKRHENIKEFNCDHCKAGFVTKQSLVVHMWIHRSEKKFNCTQCNREFNGSSNYKAHLLTHTNNPRPFQCDLCPKKYTSKHEIKQHLMATHSDKNFKCNECDFTTKTKKCLNTHKKRIHSNLKPFSCQICDKKFKAKFEVQRHHQAVHKTDKDFDCKTCGKMFGTRQILRHHERNVHGKKCIFIDLSIF